MGAASVGIDQEFIETWTKRYRCGSMNTPRRPGPKLENEIAAHPEMTALRGITTYWSLEEHIFKTIGAAVRKEGAFKLAEFMTVGYWKTPRQLANYRKNNDAKVQRITRRALTSGLSRGERPGVMSGLDGVQVPVASALLSVWSPNEFTIVDIWALKTLAHSGESIDGVGFGEHAQPWWEQHYDMYLRACLAIVKRVKPLSLRDVDRALWKWGQLNASR